MPLNENFETIAQNNQHQAWQVIEQSGVVKIWESFGATVNLVGSLAMGLLMNHKDIDLHIYTDTLDVAASFNVIQNICKNPAVKSLEYRNLADTGEACLEWHIKFLSDNAEEWQIDMIQILKGSQFDGYFERVAERIKAELTPEMRRTILELKYQTPASEHIMGIEYYRAVLAGGVRTYAELIKYRQDHPVDGIDPWCP